jgi:endonuclease/exonuclease/phosphatase family metal-dependent hydrolase
MHVSSILDHGSASPDRLRLLTHNIYGVQAGWERRRDVLRTGLQILAPDIVLLQETILTEEYDQAVDVLGTGYHLVHSSVRHTQNGLGISIASRWPITSVHELDLKPVSNRTASFPCTTLIAEIASPPPIGPLLAANHFPDYQLEHELERERQTVIAARALEHLHAEHPRHVVLGGDLDAEPDAASLRFLTGKQSLEGLSVCYRDAWESRHPGSRGETFTPRNPLMAAMNWDWPFRQIDHILVRCGEHGGPTLGIAACELAFNRAIDGVWASDHFAVVADLVSPGPHEQRPQ